MYSLGVSECNYISLGHLDRHALKGLDAANCHIPGKFHECRSQGERSVITTMQASTLKYHRTCSLHNSLDCHVQPKHITVVFVIHYGNQAASGL